ncbi:MAG: deoxyribose-phosphate aldolase [Clostridia bacterium]|nr:deoxyribose-phosphate aldolase [Clostridia bacterium]
MKTEEILSYCDHTLLSPSATWRDIKCVCDDAYEFHTASACIPPSFVHAASDYVGDQVKICTVIGFPNGYNETAVKVFETERAVKDGADEIDAVINIGKVKEGNFAFVRNELDLIRKACEGKIMKVIVETCLLSEEEKIAMCKIVTEAGADYIKTSTGFSKAGATEEDVILFKKHVGAGVKIKAAGGIRSFETAEKFISLGCSRIGASALVPLVKELKNQR